MSVWLLVQVTINLALILGIFTLWNTVRKHRNQEDPRLSRGLQLLQSKISVIEDLSDRTETQSKQLTALLNNKIKEIHDKIERADQHILAVERAISKSLEVSKIFQDKIPHQEIIERQATQKYIEAARLANRGLSIDDIASKVAIPRGELEMIVRMNRTQLVFNEADIPEWARPSNLPADFVMTPTETQASTSSSALDDLDRIRELLRSESAQTFGGGATSASTSLTFSLSERSQANENPNLVTGGLVAEKNIDFQVTPIATPKIEAEPTISFATQVLDEQLKVTPKRGRKSSVLPKETVTKPYEFKRIKVNRP